MSEAELNNYLKYALLALGAFAAGCVVALIPQLMDPTMPVLNWRFVLGTGLTAVVSTYGGTFLPRGGSTAIAAQVNALRAGGVHREDMMVVQADAAPAVPSIPTVSEIADELERRNRERAAPPKWLPPEVPFRG